MSAHDEAVEAAARVIYNYVEGPVAKQDFGRPERQWWQYRIVAAGAIRPYLSAMSAAGWKLTPREPT